MTSSGSCGTPCGSVSYALSHKATSPQTGISHRSGPSVDSPIVASGSEPYARSHEAPFQMRFLDVLDVLEAVPDAIVLVDSGGDAGV
jgi:hypothetical protein